MKISVAATPPQGGKFVKLGNTQQVEDWLKRLGGRSNTQTQDFTVLEVHAPAGVEVPQIVRTAQYFKGVSRSNATEVGNLNQGVLAPGWYSMEPLRACDFINGRSSGVRVGDIGILAFATCTVFGLPGTQYGKDRNSLSQFPGDRICLAPTFVAAALIKITKVG